MVKAYPYLMLGFGVYKGLSYPEKIKKRGVY